MMQNNRDIKFTRETLLSIYQDVYNLFESTAIEDILCFFRIKKREHILFQKRLRLLAIIVDEIEKIDFRQSALPKDYLPLGVLSRERVREISKL